MSKPIYEVVKRFEGVEGREQLLDAVDPILGDLLTSWKPDCCDQPLIDFYCDEFVDEGDVIRCWACYQCISCGAWWEDEFIIDVVRKELRVRARRLPDDFSPPM